MNMTLRRASFTPFGIFGTLFDAGENIIASTLEHSYNLLPKLPDGVYTCRRGMHRLAHMKQPFETFEICDVPGHTDILFHTGNRNEDSAGCVLLGSEVKGSEIAYSRVAFDKFMAIQAGVEEFGLTVT